VFFFVSSKLEKWGKSIKEMDKDWKLDQNFEKENLEWGERKNVWLVRTRTKRLYFLKKVLAFFHFLFSAGLQFSLVWEPFFVFCQKIENSYKIALHDWWTIIAACSNRVRSNLDFFQKGFWKKLCMSRHWK
jgi:hypothetical protein